MVASILTNILQAFYEPFWFTVILIIFVSFFYMYVTDPVGSGSGVKVALNILASGNRNSGAVETYIPDTETAFDWLNYHP